MTGRQSGRADPRSSAAVSRCKPADGLDGSSAFRERPAVAKLPVFPLNSGSPPSSPTKVNGDKEGQEVGRKRLNHSSQSHHHSSGSRLSGTPGGERGQKTQGRGPAGGKGLLTESQVRLLVGLHYLPHEHGAAAHKLLQDLNWLKTNCYLVSVGSKKALPQKVRVLSRILILG